jgi:hypothetical protein
MSNEFPGYAYLGSHRWARRESIPTSLLQKYDRLYAIAENNPGAIDPSTGRRFGAQWMDVVDEILGKVGPVFDRAALLQDRDLRNRAEHRKLDAMHPRNAPRP